MQNNEPLTADELQFIWEIDRPIKTLDTYHGSDPRIRELKQKYGLAENIDIIFEGGEFNAKKILPRLNIDEIAKGCKALLENGASIDKVFPRLYGNNLTKNYKTLLDHGCDVNTIIKRMPETGIVENIEDLLEHGGDIAKIERKLWKGNIPSFLIEKNLDTLLKNGISANLIERKMNDYAVTEHFNTLLEHGADLGEVVPKMNPEHIEKSLDTLLSYSDNDINELIRKGMLWTQTSSILGTLLEYGADANEIIANFGATAELEWDERGNVDLTDLIEKLDILLAHGADVNSVAIAVYKHLCWGARAFDNAYGFSSEDGYEESKPRNMISFQQLNELEHHGIPIKKMLH